MQTAINLYSVRELDEPMLEKVDRVAAAGYDGVQFSGGLDDATPEEAERRVRNRGLGVTGAHVGIDDLRADMAGVAETYGDMLGCDSVVVPYLGDEHFESARAAAETANSLDALADDLDSHGLGLHYHNHAHEFVDLGGETAFDRFLAESEVGVELDVGWALVGGDDPVALIDRLGDRLDLVHMKDMAVAGEEFREIGDGDVDMPACAAAARDAGASWLIYEHDQPTDPASSLDYGARYLNDLVADL